MTLLWKDERLLKVKGTKKKVMDKHYKILDEEDLKDVTGGSEFSEAFVRLFGYLSVKVEDAWKLWCEDCAYNAGMAKC